MMKKLSSLLFLVIATVIITGSCDKEDPQGGNNEDQINTPTVTTGEVTSISTTTATCSGNVKADGGTTVTARGVCWSTAENPTTSDSKTTDGTGKGTYTSNLTELSPNTQYYARAYATNSKGTAFGEQRVFKTVQGLPEVTTGEVTNIESTTATCFGNVKADGGATVTARGVCWSTAENPSTSDSKTTDGTGKGTYTSNLTDLSPDTQYYVRAYATNSKGTAYGEQRAFKTVQGLPEVTTGEVTSIETTTAICSGDVKADGGTTVTARGVCWSTAENPTTSDSKTTDGTGKGTYTSNLKDLSPDTQYYVRAYATNSKGTVYGEQRAFKTLELDICTKVTDVVFKRYLIENYDYNGDGKVTSDEAQMITKIEITGEGITSFAGIEYIPNLREFVCNFNKVKTLNLSKNIELTSLECNFCDLTSLDLSQNLHLKTLECYSNNLTSIDLSNNVELSDVTCHANKITTLDFTKNTKLTSILCSGSYVKSVNINGLSNLKRFNCSESSLVSLDLTGCTALTSLTVYDNKLTSLDITPCTKLNHLVCQKNQIASLDLTNGDFPNCPYYLVPLKCNDMPTLKTVYVKTGWRLKYITYDRSTSYIPSTTEVIYK